MDNCRECGIELIENENWVYNKPGHVSYLCKHCMSKYNKKWHKANPVLQKQYRDTHYGYQQKIMHNLKINGCAICGYNKCDAALDFHHINPEDKCFSLSMHAINYANKRVAEELSKCVLLCKNCHNEIHDKEKGGC